MAAGLLESIDIAGQLRGTCTQSARLWAGRSGGAVLAGEDVGLG